MPDRPKVTAAEAAMLTTGPSSLGRAADLRDELAELEDRAAATGWAWDAALSLAIDVLHVWLEARRA
jgi:hypothetical protein